MAFRDISKVLYSGRIKLDYKDKAHRYYVRTRVDFDLSEDDPKAWSKIIYPKGTTTLLGDTLEKKGLMTWPLGLAIRELFGFYDFTDDDGNKRTGFSKGVGTLWEGDTLVAGTKDALLPVIKSANEAWTRKQKKGADIGSIVHDAIEHYCLANPHVPVPILDENGEPTGETEIPKPQSSGFDIAEQYMWNIKEANPDPASPEFQKAMEEFEGDVECAEKAFQQFKFWWDTTSPVLYGAEDLLYSEIHNVCGTYDGDLGINKKYHPRPELFEKDEVRVTADWKTSNASSSKDAAAPEGVYYSYFIQLAIYELCRREMGFEPADDLLTVSARKDGGFSLIYASELGLTVQECIDWAIAVITCYKLADKTKKGLLAHPPEEVK